MGIQICKWHQDKPFLGTCLKPMNERKFTIDSVRVPGSLNLGKQYILLVSSFVFSFGQSEGR